MRRVEAADPAGGQVSNADTRELRVPGIGRIAGYRGIRLKERVHHVQFQRYTRVIATVFAAVILLGSGAAWATGAAAAHGMANANAPTASMSRLRR